MRPATACSSNASARRRATSPMRARRSRAPASSASARAMSALSRRARMPASSCPTSSRIPLTGGATTGSPQAAASWAARVRNAGAIFVGSFAPVSLGDYCAGSNHVLPTGGCACHSSGLSVRAFLKSVHVVEYDRDALGEVAGHVVALAEAEDLPAHGAAVRVRLVAEPGS